MLAALACLAGSIDVPARDLLLTPDDGHTPAQGVCSATPTLFPMLCDRFPALRQAPGLVRRSEELIGASMRGVMPGFPAGEGSLIDSILVKAAPRFL